MTLAISTSSPVVSVALFDSADNSTADSQLSNRNASEMVIHITDRLLQTVGKKLSDVDIIVVDRGPGSFTGVKIGITIAKVWADTIGARLFAIDSFDLISIESDVVVPYKRNAFVLRVPSKATQPVEVSGIPIGAVGYGIPDHVDNFPEARQALESKSCWIESSPRTLVPNYVVEPSISSPKSPYRSP